jgi:WhiB family redox-sensing transcriptional regulator
LTLPRVDWHRAACRDLDPDLFAPRDGEGEEEGRLRDAVQFCVQSGCPVRKECLEYALNTKQPTGVWGGLLTTEREELLAERRGSV